MIIASNRQLFAVSYDTATYHDLKYFVSEHQDYVLERIDPEKFLFSPSMPGAYINLVIKDINLRKQVTQHLDQHNADRFSLIHDRACVCNHNTVALGCMIYPMTVVHPTACIDRDVIVHSLTGIAHQCRVGVGSFISGGVTIAGNTTIGDYAHIGVDATIYDQITIAPDTVIGAATVVRKNIVEPGTYSSQSNTKLIKIK